MLEAVSHLELEHQRHGLRKSLARGLKNTFFVVAAGVCV
jgi:hypothetical protein